MKKHGSYKRIMAVLITAVWLLTGCTDAVETIYATGTGKEPEKTGPEVTEEESGQEKELLSLESIGSVPEGDWQTEAVFPDRRGDGGGLCDFQRPGCRGLLCRDASVARPL